MTIKQDRLQDRVREILSGLLLLEVTDPALKNVTVTDVRLDREIEHATVYVNALGEEGRQAEVMAGLKRANGFLRRETGKRLSIRRVPELRFIWDTTLSRGAAIDDTIMRALAEDKARADQNAQNETQDEGGQSTPSAETSSQQDTE